MSKTHTTLRQLVARLQPVAAGAALENAHNELRWLLQFTQRQKAKRDRFQLQTGDTSAATLDQTLDSIGLTQAETDSLLRCVDQRADTNLPLQYVLGSQPFAGLDLFAKPPVLIPRPETEEWVVRLAQLYSRKFNEMDMHRLQFTPPLPKKKRRFTVLDVCSGSGAVGLGLAAQMPTAKTHTLGFDKDSFAVYVSMQNVVRNLSKLRGNTITFAQQDLFEFKTLRALVERKNKVAKKLNFQFDLIVANPPYVTAREYETLDESVRRWESKDALVPARPYANPTRRLEAYNASRPDASGGGEWTVDRINELGLDFVAQIAEAASVCKLLVSHRDFYMNAVDTDRQLPRTVFEIGSERQAQAGCELLHDVFGFERVDIWNDFGGRARVITAA